jgi:hypothetical protein
MMQRRHKDRTPLTPADTYEGVESLSLFTSAQQIQQYREMLLQKSTEQIAYMRKFVPPPYGLLEIGTGNGRIPIALALEGLIDYSLGIDISKSRIEFADLWARELGLEGMVSFEPWDVLERPELGKEYNLCLCITGTFGYFAAARPGGDKLVCEYIASSMVRGGWLLLELYNHTTNRERCLQEKGFVYRHWDRLADEDPFSFYLHERTYHPDTRIMEHKKIFIRRSDGSIDNSRKEFLRLYEPEELRGLLGDSGFAIRRFDSDWSGRRFTPGDENAVILAEKV